MRNYELCELHGGEGNILLILTSITQFIVTKSAHLQNRRKHI